MKTSKPALQSSYNELFPRKKSRHLNALEQYSLKYGIGAASAASVRLLYVCASACVAPYGGPIRATPLRVLCQLLLCIPMGDGIYVIMPSPIGAYLCIVRQNDLYLVRATARGSYVVRGGSSSLPLWPRLRDCWTSAPLHV